LPTRCRHHRFQGISHRYDARRSQSIRDDDEGYREHPSRLINSGVCMASRRTAPICSNVLRIRRHPHEAEAVPCPARFVAREIQSDPSIARRAATLLHTNKPRSTRPAPPITSPFPTARSQNCLTTSCGSAYLYLPAHPTGFAVVRAPVHARRARIIVTVSTCEISCPHKEPYRLRARAVFVVRGV
jgi:hypothetical protein